MSQSSNKKIHTLNVIYQLRNESQKECENCTQSIIHKERKTTTTFSVEKTIQINFWTLRWLDSLHCKFQENKASQKLLLLKKKKNENEGSFST